MSTPSRAQRDAENRQLSEVVERVKVRRPSWGEPGSHVTRRTEAKVYSRGFRQVIVTVYPDGVIGLRLAKQRREEFVNASDAYRQAVMLRGAIEREAKRKARKARGR